MNQPRAESEYSNKRPYVSPVMQIYGNLADLTAAIGKAGETDHATGKGANPMNTH